MPILSLARDCRTAAEALCRVQTEFLNILTSEVNANAEALADGEFMLTEFVDRFGPRFGASQWRPASAGPAWQHRRPNVESCRIVRRQHLNR